MTKSAEYHPAHAIQVFLDDLNSANTRRSYGRSIRKFFLETRGKKVDDLTVDDLIFTRQEVKAYHVKLRDESKMTTANARMYALKSLYESLEEYEYPVKASWFKVKRQKESDKESYDPMTHAEVVEAINIVLPTYHGKQKALLIRLAYATAFRKESLLELKKTDVIQRDGVWLVKVLGKGDEWDHKKISNDLYEELKARMDQSKNDKVFTLTVRTVRHMMDLIRSKIDFGNRNITFHSLKKSSIEEVRIITNNDLKAMQTHGGHKNAKTTVDSYLQNKKLDDLVIVDIHYHVPVEAFESLSREELLKLVLEADRNTQIRLLQQLGVI